MRLMTNAVPDYAHELSEFADRELKMDHFVSMCDSTGMLQHAVYSVPDRDHGYCVDDNARALLVACALQKLPGPKLPQEMTARFAAFIQHAWNPDNRRFRNFMSYERRWLEDTGSEDSHGRTLWALGTCARDDIDPSRRQWATNLFSQALYHVESFSSPRAWAFTLLGLNACFPSVGNNPLIERTRNLLVERLQLMVVGPKHNSWPADWHWFEDVLAYDNARLPQALIQTGLTLGHRDYIESGLRSLHWLTAMQTAPTGVFRPVGSNSFGNRFVRPAQFDQQPVEAAATISACLTAARISQDRKWTIEAENAFGWFYNRNDLGATLIDSRTGGCFDGLHPDRVNGNMGAESVLSYLMSVIELRAFRSEAISSNRGR
jgi:hypothetical protein